MSQVKRKEANRQKPELKKMEKQMSSLHADTTGWIRVIVHWEAIEIQQISFWAGLTIKLQNANYAISLKHIGSNSFGTQLGTNVSLLANYFGLVSMFIVYQQTFHSRLIRA